MSYAPKNKSISIGDTWHIFDGKKVQAFFLQFQKQNQPPVGKDYGGIGRAESRDMITWKTLPTSVYRGKEGEYDDLEIWTGCTFFYQGKYYLFYTSRSSTLDRYSISVAISKNGKDYQKYEGNPVLTIDEKYYIGKNSVPTLAYHGNPDLEKDYDLRDMCVVRDDKNDCFWGFFACRVLDKDIPTTSVIGLAKSVDLLHWEQLPPAFAPKKYHCIETPDVFYKNGKWFMLCLAGNVYGQKRVNKEKLRYNRTTIYAVSDSVFGPYTEPKDNTLISTIQAGCACAKTVAVKGERYIIYTEVNENKTPNDLFMSLPKKIMEKNGKLKLYYYKGLDKYRKETLSLCEKDVLENDGRFGSIGTWDKQGNSFTLEEKNDWSILPFQIPLTNFILEGQIENLTAEEVGFVFGIKNNAFEGLNAITLDYVTKTIDAFRLRSFKMNEQREILPKRKFRLKIVVIGDTVDVYVNEQFLIQSLSLNNAGYIGFYVQKGKAIFTDVKYSPLKEIQND